MMPTEKQALRWLQNGGYTNIKFRQTRTPDFATDQGGFEVKRVSEYNTIYFHGNQLERIIEDNAQVLVFKDGYEEPDIILEPADLRKETVKGYMLKTYESGATTILISKGFYKAIQELAEKERRSAAAQLAVILESAGIKEVDE